MSVRDTSYIEYGLTKEDVNRLIEYCISATADTDLINECAKKSNIGIANYIVLSVVNSWSYDRMQAKWHIPMKKTDFYGYRRKFFAILNEQLKG